MWRPQLKKTRLNYRPQTKNNSALESTCKNIKEVKKIISTAFIVVAFRQIDILIPEK
jgi:hypothetical protein